MIPSRTTVRIMMAVLLTAFVMSENTIALGKSLEWSGGITSGIMVPLNKSTLPTIGGKLIFPMNSYTLIGGRASYIYLGEKAHEGQVGFIWDFNIKLAKRVDFLIGTDIGFSGSREGAAIFVQPGLGLLFHMKPIAIELKTGAWLPWWMRAEQFSAHSIRVVTTLSFLYERPDNVLIGDSMGSSDSGKRTPN